MARRATTKRAKSLKRSDKPAASVTQVKRLVRSRTYKVADSARQTLKAAQEFVKQSLIANKAATKKQREQEAKEAARVQRYYEIRSNVTVLRGPLQVTSSWVNSIAYMRYGRRNGVAVEFKDKQGHPTVQVFYQNTTLRDYDYLRKSASKGKAIHRRFYDLPYELMN